MVEYGDTETQKQMTQELHDRMVADGEVVQIESREDVAEHYPDLRGVKKQERNALLKEKIGELKRQLRAFLQSLRPNTYEFEVDGGVLEARIYDAAIREVTDRLTEAKSNMLYQSEEIFNNARYLYSTPDYEGNPQIYRWNYFYTPVQIGGDIVGVRIAVRDSAQGNASQIYHWGIKNNRSVAVPGQGNQSHPIISSLDRSVDSISQDGAIVNPAEENAGTSANRSDITDSGTPDRAVSPSATGAPQGKERQFIYNTLKNSEVFGGVFQDVYDELVSQDPDATRYDVVHEMESMYNAAQRVQNDPYAEAARLTEENGHEWSEEDIDTAMGLIAKFRSEGNFAAANDLAVRVARAGTQMGQSIQAFAKWSRTPTGIATDAIARLNDGTLSNKRVQELTRILLDSADVVEKVQSGAGGTDEAKISLIETIRTLANFNPPTPCGVGQQ